MMGSLHRLQRCLALLVFVSSAAAHAQPAPNILLLMAEDLSARISAFGDPVARTPNIDRLAARGVRFPNTFTAAGVCAPSRAAMITGVHQISLGAQHMGPEPEALPTESFNRHHFILTQSTLRSDE